MCRNDPTSSRQKTGVAPVEPRVFTWDLFRRRRCARVGGGAGGSGGAGKDARMMFSYQGRSCCDFWNKKRKKDRKSLTSVFSCIQETVKSRVYTTG